MALDYISDACVITRDPNWNWTELRLPNPVSCPVVQPETPNRTWCYGQRWATDFAALGLPVEKDYGNGVYLLSKRHPAMPVLAESANASNPIRGQSWANSVNDPWTGFDTRIRISHRGKAVASWPDGHVTARTATQLLTEDRIFKVWSPP